MAYEQFDIASALDSGTNKDVQKALCQYIIDNDYNRNICKYINSENWLEGFEESKKSISMIICEKNLNDHTNDPTCTQEWHYTDGDFKVYQKSIHACIEDAEIFMKKGFLCYIDDELVDKPDVFDDPQYFRMELKPKSNKKSMKESKVMSFEEFEDICYDNFSFAIDHTHEYKGAYFVVVYGDERQTEKFAKILRNHGLETTWYRLDDPHNECYLCYEIMAF